MNTPVALFLFNRPDTTAQVLNVLRRVRPRTLYVIADGSRADHPDDAALCRATRALVTAPDWKCEVRTLFSDTNLGVKRRVESGLDWVFTHTEQAIILEDDCVPHPTFFPFCDELLARYRAEPRVMGISGSSMRAEPIAITDSYYFSRYPFIWGWATWARAWTHYDSGMSEWTKRRADDWLAAQVETPLAQRYWDMLFQNNYETQHTWDYTWIFSSWLANGLFITPRVNLVSNIGHGAAATHTVNARDPFAGLPTQAMQFPLRHPDTIARNVVQDQWNEEHVYSGKDFRPALFHALRARIQTTRAARSDTHAP